jgi:hypothetical protein
MANPQNPFVPEDTPVGLKAIYPMASVNQSVKLYVGDLELEQGTKRLSGKGVVQFEWLPRPGLRFSLALASKNQHQPQLENGILHMLGINWHAKVSVLGYAVFSGKRRHNVTGSVDDFELGQGQNVAAILFHVTNFKNYFGLRVRDDEGTKTSPSRAVIEAGEWRITLDGIEESKRIFDELKDIGGFAITHVGKLERLDGKKFAAKTSEKVFDALFRYLSFCRGAWVAPILAVGFDENGDRVWEKWRGWKMERWKNVHNWFNDHSEEGLSKGFAGFYRLWQDEKWKEPLLLSNHWYVEANMSAGGVEGSIILAQSAFELLGWTHFVEEKMALSEKGYEGLSAMDKIRLLLSISGIPSIIPSSLSKLTAAAKAKENQWKDGPQAITEVRNALVHSNPTKRRKVFDEHHALVHESWRLSLWYLELILLKTFNYEGKYSNRTAPTRWKGEEVETVPWA